jgi:inner membrane protein
MDSLTHIAIGACMGDLFLGKKIGKKAMLYGAVAASLPDIDVVASLWLNPAADLLAHRGFTHSLLFALLVMAGFTGYFRKRHALDDISVKYWLLFLGTAIGSHLFLDAFNAYGIGLFEPFSHYRISGNTIFVADPFFSLWPVVSALALLVLGKKNVQRKKWASFGLIFCSAYLLYCGFNKFRIDDHARYALIHQGIHYNRYITTPTPFNNLLWYVIAETEDGFYTGYRSVLDKTDSVDFHYFPKNRNLLASVSASEDLHDLIRFSQGYYTVDSSGQGLIFNDLRFGQMMGWQYPSAGFVFHFYLQRPDQNRFVVQRGRFADWNKKSVSFFIKRMKGNGP